MVWYDIFAGVYDASVERHYEAYRAIAADALALREGDVVLDCPCGTGQAFDALAAGVGDTGRVIGLDQSKGMLRRARMRIQAKRQRNVCCVQNDAANLDRPTFERLMGGPVPIDALHIFLGMTVFPQMESTFAQLWSLLAPGGRCVVVDVHARQPGLQGWAVEKIAGAELHRRFWEPLEQWAMDFERIDLAYRRQHGGQIMLASGTKPEAV